MLSFVAQENSLLGVLTVKETMDYAARLSGAPDASAVDTMVADTLHELGMESTAETKVGDIFYKGISGGQKRRLSIGATLRAVAMLWGRLVLTGCSAAVS